MTRTRWTTAAALATSLLVAACGGSGGATTAPATATSGPATAPATVAPPSGDAGGVGLGGAAAKLEELASYKFAMTMAAEGSAGFSLVKAGTSLTISGTVILKPVIAADITMTTRDATGAEGAFGYRIIGDKAYVSLGADTWMETAADDAQSTIDSFKPQNFMTGFGSIDDMKVVGDDDRNGVATTHYQGDAPASVGRTFGLPNGTWTMDAWIAKDGGYLVSSSAVGEAPDGKFTISVDITDLDSSDNSVEPPAKFTPMGG